MRVALEANEFRRYARDQGEAMKQTQSEPADTTSIPLSAFVQGATHEIANPLSSITMGVEVARLLLQRNQPEGVAEILDRMLVDCTRCATLLRGMQRFASGLQAHARERVSARAFVEAAIALFRADSTAELNVRIEADDVSIEIDRPALEHACIDLLQNALDAGADDVEVVIRKAEGVVSVAVRDNGSGISADAITRLTEPFFSTRRAQGKSGLGLTLIDDLAKAHGGELRFAANSPRGAAVELRFPSASEAS